MYKISKCNVSEVHALGIVSVNRYSYLFDFMTNLVSFLECCLYPSVLSSFIRTRRQVGALVSGLSKPEAEVPRKWK